MAKPLHERLASARSTDRVTITDLEALIAEATAELEGQSALAVQAGADAVNFALSEADRDDAAARGDRARRNAQALAAAIDELTGKLDAKRASASRKAAQDDRDACLAERDALAQRLRTAWPGIEGAIVELLGAVQANDARMRALGIHEASAEAIARGCDGMFRIGANPVRRLTEIMLPSFDEGWRLAWPKTNILNTIAFDLTAIRREQIEARDRAEAEEIASWHPYRIRPTNRARFWTRIHAKDSADQPAPREIDIYNHEPNAMFDETERRAYELFLKQVIAADLGRNGFIVEALGSSEAAA